MIHVEGLCIGGPKHGEFLAADKLTVDVAIFDNPNPIAYRKELEPGPPKMIEYETGWYEFTTNFGVLPHYTAHGSIKQVEKPCWVYMGLKK